MVTEDDNILTVFSESYFITNRDVNVVEWGGDYPVVSPELYEQLSYDGSPVVIKTGLGHCNPYTEAAIPLNTLALPEDDGGKEERGLLVARPGQAEYLLGQDR